MRTEILNFDTQNGPTTAYVAVPDGPTGKAVLIVHEWWGLNNHVKDIANRYASEGFIAVAPDLYRGKIAANPEEASRMMHGLAIEDGIDTIHNAAERARAEYGIERFGITGYCMGGTFALRAACDLSDFRASAPFYGDIPEDEVLKRLTTPTVFISGTRDAWITPEKVAGLESAAARFGLSVESKKYDADHAFFNDTRPEVYDPTAAADAWRKVIGFFSETL